MRKTMTKSAIAMMMALMTTVPFAGAVEPEPTADITIDGSASQYSAYRLLNLTTSLKGDCAHGAEGEHTDECWNYAYTVNEKYRTVLQTVCGEEADTDGTPGVSDSEIIAYIGGMADNGDEIRAFADEIYEQAVGLGADYTDSGKTFADVPQGYYLITESTLAADPDSRSLVMLDTAGQGEVTVTAKEGVPTLTKQVQEVNDSTGSSVWQDAADFDVGDKVKFRLMGNMPSNISAYNSYKYIFHDTLANGFALDEDSISVSIAGKNLSTGEFTVHNSDFADDCTFEVEIADVVSLAASKSVTLTADTQITVEYEATLLDAANIGQNGNDNTAHLEFSNDPYDAESTSDTVEGTVTVFTYQLQVDKTDSSGTPLSGANFTLMKHNGSDYVSYKEISASDDQTTFQFVGLDAGKYKLVESQVPAGFNKAADLEFEVVSTYDTTSDDPALTALQVKQGEDVVSGEPESGELFEVDLASGSIVTAIVNNSGIHLPSTGGMGTMLIYSAGALLIVGGCVYIVLKKRTKTSK